jgi:hypothetical protein
MILLIIMILMFAGDSFNICYVHMFFPYAVLIAFSQPLSLIIRLLAWIRWLYSKDPF